MWMLNCFYPHGRPVTCTVPSRLQLSLSSFKASLVLHITAQSSLVLGRTHTGLPQQQVLIAGVFSVHAVPGPDKINPRGPHTALLPLPPHHQPQSALVSFSAPAMVPSRWRALDRAQLPEFRACSELAHHASHMGDPRCCSPTTRESDIYLYRVPAEGVSASASNPGLKASGSCTGPISPRTTLAREAGSEQRGAKAMAGSYFEEVFMPTENGTLSEL